MSLSSRDIHTHTQSVLVDSEAGTDWSLLRVNQPSQLSTENFPAKNRSAEDIERDAVEAEWPLDADGFPHRQAARVVMLSPDGHIYLVRGHDLADSRFWWWFTPGGGVLEGESLSEAAARELKEETGLAVHPSRMHGPILYRQATFRFIGSTRKQDEHFFLVHVSAEEVEEVNAGLGVEFTELERNVLDGAAWFTISELQAVQARGELVFPACLEQLVVTNIDGWNGDLVILNNDENEHPQLDPRADSA